MDGKQLAKFDSPEAAAQQLLPQLSREEVEHVNTRLIETLQKMRVEREDIIEKNTALEDAVGKLLKEKIYLQRQLASAINAMTDQQKRMADRMQQITEQRSPATALSPLDPEQ